jgi:hypothetical protein
MRCTSFTPSPAPPNGEYLPKSVDPLKRVGEVIFDRGNDFLIQSTHHQLPRHQAASPNSLRFMRYTTPSTCTWATCRQLVNGQNINFEECLYGLKFTSHIGKQLSPRDI